MSARNAFINKESIGVTFFFKADTSGARITAIWERTSVYMAPPVVERFSQHGVLLICSYSKFSHVIITFLFFLRGFSVLTMI